MRQWVHVALLGLQRAACDVSADHGTAEAEAGAELYWTKEVAPGGSSSPQGRPTAETNTPQTTGVRVLCSLLSASLKGVKF